MSFITEQYAGMASDLARYRDEKNWNVALNELSAKYEWACNEINSCRQDLAHALAQRAALVKFVRNLVDDETVKIPIFDDADLWDKIGKAGVSAFVLTNDWEAVKNAGRTFKIPDVPDPFGNIVSRDKLNSKVIEANKLIAAANERIQKAEGEAKALTAQINENTEAMSHATSLVAKQKRDIAALNMTCAHHMAQAAAFRQQLLLADPQNPLIVDSGLRERVADAAYSQLVANNFTDWSVVKQVGASFLSSNERLRATQVEPDNTAPSPRG